MDQLFKKNDDGSIEYKGLLYKKTDKYYYRSGKHCRVIYLHREVYEDFYGEIPKGYVVHHKDGNKINNSPDNLEIIKRGDHSRLHNTGHVHSEEARKKMSEAIQRHHKYKRFTSIPIPN